VRLGNALIGRATSTDGVTWTKDGAPVLNLGAGGSFDDDQVAEPRVLKLASGYRMYYTGRKAGTTNNALGVASSSDGIAWTKSPSNPILLPRGATSGAARFFTKATPGTCGARCNPATRRRSTS
jgi:predicted GH43/DUF377 family glycosyl hydrolase